MIKFNQQFFKSNRQRLKQLCATDDPILITANGIVQRGADNGYPFTQDANFWYLSGISDPDITLVMEGDREFLIVPMREGTRVTFDGQIDQSSLSSASGINDIVNEITGWKRIDSLLDKNKRLATLSPAPAFIKQYGIYANPSRARLMERLERHVSDLELIDIRPQLANMRMIKQDIELAAIQSAIDITSDTLKEVMTSNKKDYSYEYQIEADITRGFRYRGADGHAFEPIVAGGIRACTLHNVTNDSLIQPGELIVLDVGASVSGYAADLTRVLASSKPTQRQKDIFAAVKETQSFAMDLLKPGTQLRAYEAKVAKFLGTKLKQLGLISNLKEASIRDYYPHATSHFLGLNVHDVGDYQQPLRPGMVMTVEPGIYIPQEGIGVRLEDDVLITDTGIKVLSQSLPCEL